MLQKASEKEKLHKETKDDISIHRKTVFRFEHSREKSQTY